MSECHARWSKLQKLVKGLVTPGLGLQIHCNRYRMKSKWGQTDLPRYWITLGREIIWDYPAHFAGQGALAPQARPRYPYGNDVDLISEMIREYVDTPRAELLGKHFRTDRWGLADIMRAADRRIGAGRLRELAQATESAPARKVIQRRLGVRSSSMPAECATHCQSEARE